jgi:hypothetical protein
MAGKLWRLPLYPLLIAAYFPLYMMASDQGMTDVSEVIRPAVVCVLFALGLMALLGVLLRDIHRAALWVAMFVILIFGVKFIQRIISGANEGGVEHIPGLYLLGAMAALAALLGLFARPGPSMTRIANVVMAVMVAFPVMSLVQRELTVNVATADAGSKLQPDPGFQTAVDTGMRPNIIHIVLDGYSRQDVLAELYGFDNAPFLDRLRELGFAVADRATTPYNQTLLVMDSVFSGTMLEGSERFGSAIELRDNLRAQLRHNPVMAALSRLKYQTAAVDVRYDPVRMDFLDRLLSANTISNFEDAIFQRTSLYQLAYRLGMVSPSIIPEVFSTAYEREMASPYFLYVHLLAPHPPFDVNRHGQVKKQEGGPRGMMDGNHFTDNTDDRREVYRRGYVEKLQFTNLGILSMVQRIISEADEPTIIIIHGDHGGGLHLDHNSPADTCLKERLSPLLAVYASDERLQRALPDDLNLANIYRLVFNTYFSTAMPLLPNRSVFAGWKNPAEQQTIPPEQLEQSCRPTQTVLGSAGQE